MLLPNSVKKKFPFKKNKFFALFKNNQSGQILIIFLLVLVVGLAIALSIASRTVTDIRQTTTSDESNRAYFAAEAGVERALKQISENPTFSGETIDFTDVNQSQANVVVSALTVPVGTVFEIPGKVSKDEVVQFYLMSEVNNIATAGVAPSILAGDVLNFYWDESGSSGTGSALEVSVLQCSGNPCTSLSTFTIAKMTYDPDFARSSSNSFCNNVSSAGFTKTTNLGNSYTYKYRISLDLNSPGLCTRNDTVTNRPVLARIRLLYSGTVRVAVESDTTANPNRPLPSQGQKIESVGTTPSGVSRKLTVTKLHPALPSIFDYVLFNGSTSNPLTKP